MLDILTLSCRFSQRKAKYDAKQQNTFNCIDKCVQKGNTLANYSTILTLTIPVLLCNFNYDKLKQNMTIYKKE